MNYRLTNSNDPQAQNPPLLATLKKLWTLMQDEKTTILWASLAILINSAMTLFAPIVVGKAVDNYIVHRDFHGVLMSALLLLGMYIIALGASYAQTRVMGGVGQRVLFNLRNAIFVKLQSLPVAFFNQNKAGDLISRINNDTDKLNQFFSQSLMQFLGNIFVIIGAMIFVVVLNVRLGLAALVPALVLLIFTRVLSDWVKRKNLANLQTTGGLSAEIQESLDNFKVIVAFNRRDYFRERFAEVNEENFKSSITAGLANNVFTPVYGLASNIAQIIVLAYGIYLIAHGHFTIGLLISYLSYVSRFYDPLRQMAAIWANLQLALAGWDRISEILALESNLPHLESGKSQPAAGLLTFDNVTFGYPDSKPVLRNIDFTLESGKTYALVGPTGGGKTTTASLMARLYDPTKGTVWLDGRDMRTYTDAERTQKIGFILQEPYLFSGTVRDNLVYGNPEYKEFTSEQLLAVLKDQKLDALLSRFEDGLDTKILPGADTISLGQKQLLAFIRAVLRKPDLLILDEATANIDTVTEQLLDEVLKQLPKTTTRVIIAHRLNTIEHADEIFFVNGGTITRAGSFDHAVNLLMHGARKS